MTNDDDRDLYIICACGQEWWLDYDPPPCECDATGDGDGEIVLRKRTT